jgi:G3E family GTPase
MSTEIIVVSGFLGAGKTTLIQKLLNEAFRNEKVVLIENDFGDISVDAALLKSGGIEVKEINSGCICCSLSGDFIKALKELLNCFKPDKIVIEPSGVGKLSDIIKACSDFRIMPLARVKSKITIADVKRCKMYLDNFGEFFEDQIRNANVILLSRVEEFPDKINAAQEIIRNLNPDAAIFSKPWEQIDADEILYPNSNASLHIKNHVSTHIIKRGCHSVHSSKKRKHAHDCCGHNHAAEDVFDTVTIHTNRIFSIQDLTSRVSRMERDTKGTVLRAKGIVCGVNGYMNMQYVSGDIQVSDCTSKGNMICIIGYNLDKPELSALFSEE